MPLRLGRGFKYGLFSPRLIGEDFQCDVYFSGRLKPPTRGGHWMIKYVQRAISLKQSDCSC